MALLEKLCASISQQLKSYTEQIQTEYISTIDSLQQDNLSLIEKLSVLNSAESQRGSWRDDTIVRAAPQPTLANRHQSLSKSRRGAVPKSPRIRSPRTPVSASKTAQKGQCNFDFGDVSENRVSAHISKVSVYPSKVRIPHSTQAISSISSSQYPTALEEWLTDAEGQIEESKDVFGSESSQRSVAKTSIPSASVCPSEDMELQLSKLTLFSSQTNTQTSEGQTNLDGAMANWYRIVATMTKMSMLNVSRAKLESCLQLRPTWETLKHDRPKRRSQGWKSWSVSHTLSSCGTKDDRSSMKTSYWSRFVFHPDSKTVTFWSLLGAAVILYDIMTFPMAGFDLEDGDAAIAIMWLTAIFWTSDIFATLIRGVHYKGVIEMRPSRILFHYARTWMVIDVSMVTIDWLFIYLTTGSGSNLAGASKVLRSGKAIRAARVVRAVRLLRTIKVFHLLRDLFENMKSEYLQLLIKLIASILCILVTSHYVTCAWFAQAHFNNADSKTWIKTFLNTDPRPHVATEYVTSMHFSLTQLAGSQDIVPQNAQERWIASVIIVFDIVVFSSLVGVITDIMAQFRALTYERNKEVSSIRQFFLRTRIKPVIENRVWHFFRRHYRSKTRFVSEGDIAFFKTLPSSLRTDLNEQLYVPELSNHPLFRSILSYDRYSMLAVCGTALNTKSYAVESEVFAEGDLAKSMFFCTSGLLKYNSLRFEVEIDIGAHMWVCEVVLWTKWMHGGSLTVVEECVVVQVDAEAFEKTVFDRADNASWFRSLKMYAALFAQRVSDSFDTHKPISDVDTFFERSVEALVLRAFGEETYEPDPQADAGPAVPAWKRAFTMFTHTGNGTREFGGSQLSL